VTARVRLTKTPEQYLMTREQRRELPYEAVLASGRTRWSVGERLRVYRAGGKRAALLPDPEEGDDSRSAYDPLDYDIDYYVRVLAETFGARLERALDPDDFASVFADPGQLTLFPKRLADARPILTVLESAV
jgi:DNA polymerase I